MNTGAALNIAILSHYPFPSGMAGTNRLASLSKGLVEQGNKVKIFCIVPTEKKDSVLNTQIEGSFEGVEFEYTAGTLIWPDSKRAKLWAFLRGYLRSLPIIFRFHRRRKIDHMISTSGNMQINLLYYFFCKLFRIKFSHTQDEYPIVVREAHLFHPAYRFIYMKIHYRLFDGMIIMTKRLMEYYREFVRKDAKLIHIPMTVDCARFESCLTVWEHSEDQYIAYCGTFDSTNNKDGIDILIKAFGEINDIFPEVKLYLIGGAVDREKQSIADMKKLAMNLGLNDRVVFTGKIHRDKMPEMLRRATVLALARPNSIQAESGFPTKLGEYLMTGNPVVVTAVGEIPDYLEDRKSAFIAEPDSVDSFAEKLKEALGDIDFAKKVGAAGREVARAHFDYRIHAQALTTFLRSLREDKVNVQ